MKNNLLMTTVAAIAMMGAFSSVPAKADSEALDLPTQHESIQSRSGNDVYSRDLRPNIQPLMKPNPEVQQAAAPKESSWSRMWNKTASAETAKADRDIQHVTLLQENSTSNRAQELAIDSRMTAEGMIGEPVLNMKGDKIASVKDVILDADGDASLIVVSDGGFIGIGSKLAAFDYNLVTQRSADGDVIMPISEESIKAVREFSYDGKDFAGNAKTNARIMPADSFSTAKLLDAGVKNPKGDTVASVEDITLRGGSAGYLVLDTGLGSRDVAVEFDKVALKQADDDFTFHLTQAQADALDALKRVASLDIR